MKKMHQNKRAEDYVKGDMGIIFTSQSVGVLDKRQKNSEKSFMMHISVNIFSKL